MEGGLVVWRKIWWSEVCRDVWWSGGRSAVSVVDIPVMVVEEEGVHGLLGKLTIEKSENNPGVIENLINK